MSKKHEKPEKKRPVNPDAAAIQSALDALDEALNTHDQTTVRAILTKLKAAIEAR